MEGGKKGQGRAEGANIVVPARCKVTWPTVGSLGKQDFVMDSMCRVKERKKSRMTPTLGRPGLCDGHGITNSRRGFSF